MKKSTAAATAIAVLGSTIVSALPSPKAGGARQGAMIDLQGTKALKTDSVHGHRLLSKAKVVREGNHASHLRSTHRRAEGEANYYNWNNNNNNNNNYDNEYGLYNLPELYIQYSGCSSFMVPDQDGGEENQEQGQQQQNYNYNNDNNANNANNNNNNDNLYMSNLVLFTLCDSADCSSCSGEYAVDLLEFVDTYTEMKMEDQEYQCEYVREHCYCSYNNYNKNQNNNNQYNNNNNNNAANAYSYNDGGNDDGAGGRQLEYSNYYYNCLASCYAKAGLDSCMNQYYGGEEFQLQEYLECRQAFGDGNNNNNNNQNNFYIGPYCSDNLYVYLGAFYDEDCSYAAPADDFQAMNYGDGFPYFDEPIIAKDECLSCLKEDENDNNNNNNNNNNDAEQYDGYNQNYESNELCERATEEAIKCDYDRGYSSGCYFLETTLPCMDGRGCPATDDDDDDGFFSSGGHGNFTSSDMYNEMVQKLQKNKRIAIAMGAIAAGLMFILTCLFIYCCCCYTTPSHNSLRRKAKALLPQN